jgi:hypothetical protein
LRLLAAAPIKISTPDSVLAGVPAAFIAGGTCYYLEQSFANLACRNGISDCQKWHTVSMEGMGECIVLDSAWLLFHTIAFCSCKIPTSN